MTVGGQNTSKLKSGKIPAYRDDKGVLADSSVICAYLERTNPTPQLYPSDPYAYARALWFEEYGDGGLVPVFGPNVFFQRIVQPRFFNQPTDEAEHGADRRGEH